MKVVWTYSTGNSGLEDGLTKVKDTAYGKQKIEGIPISFGILLGSGRNEPGSQLRGNMTDRKLGSDAGRIGPEVRVRYWENQTRSWSQMLGESELRTTFGNECKSGELGQYIYYFG